MKAFLYSAAALIFFLAAALLSFKQDVHGVTIMLGCALAMGGLYWADEYASRNN